jgi:hypothetical protein|nr:MAG TPA: hypothetical protein [Bacteriophage sp.]
MNQQMMQILNQIRGIRNPQQAAMQALQQAASSGNPMATNILSKINSGDMNGAGQILNNCMDTNGINMNEIRSFFGM